MPIPGKPGTFGVETKLAGKTQTFQCALFVLSEETAEEVRRIYESKAVPKSEDLRLVQFPLFHSYSELGLCASVGTPSGWEEATTHLLGG